MARVSRVSRMLLAVASLACLSVPARAARVEEAPAVRAFDRAFELVKGRFYDSTFRGLPWDRLVEERRRLLVGDPREERLKAEADALLSLLRVSHTGFYSSSDMEYWALQSIFSGSLRAYPLCQSGAWFERQGESWFVRSVPQGSPASEAGIRAGDEVLAVDGAPFSPVDSFRRPEGRPCSTPRELRLRRAKGSQPFGVRVRPRHESVQASLLRATRASERVFFVGKARVGYVHLWSGTHPGFQEALHAAIDRLAESSDALVLDLRDGFGGAHPEYVAPFFGGGPGGAPRYPKPVVALVNDGVRSGKEWVAYVLKKSGRAALLGTPTAGAFVRGSVFAIAPGRHLLYLAVGDFSPPGVTEPIEGVGVAPDEVVPFERPYSRGQDPQLRRALRRAAAEIRIRASSFGVAPRGQ